MPPSERAKTHAAADIAVGVSDRSVDHATKVLKHGTPELIKAVDEGRIAVSNAAALASQSKQKQREATCAAVGLRIGRSDASREDLPFLIRA